MDSRLVRICQLCNYKCSCWKLVTGFLELNDKGQYILPFSRRVIDLTLPLPMIKGDGRQQQQQQQHPSSFDYELYAGVGYENKNWQQKEEDDNHIIKEDSDNDDDADQVTTSTDRHMNYIQYDTNNENTDDDEQNQSSLLDDNSNYDYTEENDHVDTSQLDSVYETFMSSTLSYSPFPCGDPYDSYDWEC